MEIEGLILELLILNKKSSLNLSRSRQAAKRTTIIQKILIVRVREIKRRGIEKVEEDQDAEVAKRIRGLLVNMEKLMNQSHQKDQRVRKGMKSIPIVKMRIIRIGKKVRTALRVHMRMKSQPSPRNRTVTDN